MAASSPSPSTSPAPDMPFAQQKLTRAEQSRVNGARSRGPTTPAGKAVSSRNATRHGFSSPHALVIAGEDAAAFNQVHADLLTAWAPDCPDGCQLVAQLALAYLQHDRAGRWQVGLFAGDGSGMVNDLPQFALMMRYSHGIERQIRRLREQLRQLHERPLQGCLMVGDPKLAEHIPLDGEDEPTPPAQDLRNEPEIPSPPPRDEPSGEVTKRTRDPRQHWLFRRSRTQRADPAGPGQARPAPAPDGRPRRAPPRHLARPPRPGPARRRRGGGDAAAGRIPQPSQSLTQRRAGAAGPCRGGLIRPIRPCGTPARGAVGMMPSMSISSEPIIQSIWMRLLLPPCAAISSGVSVAPSTKHFE